MDESIFQATLWTDGELPVSALQLDTLNWIEQLGPWGQKFPLPQFEGYFKVIDFRWLKETHLKLRLAIDQYSFDAIAFNAAGRFEFDPMRDHVHLVYEIDRNVFNGNVSLQLRIVHLNQ